jgi:hypothetical protein
MSLEQNGGDTKMFKVEKNDKIIEVNNFKQ